jgi:hypothetical protein
LLPLRVATPQNQEFVRPGFELGYKEDGKFYIFNHLQFNILVHPTHGEYMRARQGFKDAAVLDNIDARRMLLSKKQLLAAGASEAALGGSSSSGRQLAADDAAKKDEAGACWDTVMLEQPLSNMSSTTAEKSGGAIERCNGSAATALTISNRRIAAIAAFA